MGVKKQASEERVVSSTGKFSLLYIMLCLCAVFLLAWQLMALLSKSFSFLWLLKGLLCKFLRRTQSMAGKNLSQILYWVWLFSNWCTAFILNKSTASNLGNKMTLCDSLFGERGGFEGFEWDARYSVSVPRSAYLSNHWKFLGFQPWKSKVHETSKCFHFAESDFMLSQSSPIKY